MVQTEGAGDEGGRGPSTWDRFIQDGVGERDIAVDSYNRYKVCVLATVVAITSKSTIQEIGMKIILKQFWSVRSTASL